MRPIRHGGLLAAGIADGETVLIIDGLFHHNAPVRHKEILKLIDNGVRVAGCSSIGALRAAELHAYGMKGIGQVFELYRRGVLENDDAVAVLQSDDGTDAELSTALVNIMFALDEASGAGIVASSDAADILAAASAMPYSARSWRRLAILGASENRQWSAALQAVRDWMTGFPESHFNVKYNDAVLALRWLSAAGNAPFGSGAPSGPDSNWRNSIYLQHWLRRYESGPCGAPLLAICQYQQLYDPDFPARWRQFILGWIADGSGEQPTPCEGTAAGGPAVAERALAAAALLNITFDNLARHQLEYWLSEAELGSQEDKAELTLRILVRSCAWTPAAAEWRNALNRTLLTDVRRAGHAVVSSFELNKLVASRHSQCSVERLRADVLRQHLTDEWQVEPAAAGGLRAAARDRGFQDERSAMQAARNFFLSVTGVLSKHRR
jgi:hypothetical protein